MTTPPRAQILDACVLINLLASGEAEGVLRAAARDSFICAAVEKEAVYLRSDYPNSPLELVSLSPYVEAGLLAVCNVAGAVEMELYVDYAAELDDGEAMSLAIALSRDFILATDERKARRLFLEAARDQRRLASTSGLMRAWAEGNAVPAERLRSALLRIESRARYQPPPADANHRWWVDASR